MSRFIVLYCAPESATEQMASMTPEQMQEGMAPWMAWMEKCGAALVDGGAPFGARLTMSPEGSGPNRRDITGYSILEAEDMAAAEALLAGHPHFGFGPGCEIEVHECVQIGM